MSFKELLGKKMLFFDGATGTQLQARGLQPGELPVGEPALLVLVEYFAQRLLQEFLHQHPLEDVGDDVVDLGVPGLGCVLSGLECLHESVA